MVKKRLSITYQIVIDYALLDIWPTLYNGALWIEAQILQESGGNPKAVSHAGAKGLMQLMPGTAREMNVNDVLNPVENIRGGIRYLKIQYDRFPEIKTSEDRLRWSFAAYNGGRGYCNKALALARLDGVSKWWLWFNSSPYFADPRCIVNGKRPDHRQITGYITAIERNFRDLSESNLG